MMDAKPNQHTQLLLVILAIVALPVAIFYRTKPAPFSAMLVPLGTNTVAAGTAFYSPANGEQGGTILESDNAYEFPDGSTKPGLLVKLKANGVGGLGAAGEHR